MKSDRTNPASAALKGLREALQLSQQDFAVRELGNAAVTTVSRYESGNPPPRGDALLKLRRIALEHERRRDDELKRAGEDTEKNIFRHLRIQFERVWAEEIYATPGSEGVRTIVMGPDGTGLLVAHLKRREEFPAASTFLHLIQQLESSESRFRENALEAFKQAQKSERRFDSPGTHDFDDAIMGTLPAPRARKRGRPPKSESGDRTR